MAVNYTVRGGSDESIIPVADGDFLTPDMTNVREAELSSIRFFSDSEGQIQVTPSAGTVTFTGSPDGVNFYTVDNGTFDAADAYLETRMKPYAQGDMKVGKVTLSGVVGAAYFKAEVWRA